jgi:molybdopterin converting factor small subunit
MALVKVPVPMKAYTENQTEFHISGSTVGEVVEKLVALFPAVRDYILNDRQQLRPFVTIFVNQENIRDLQSLETPLKDDDRLMMIFSIAGG